MSPLVKQKNARLWRVLLNSCAIFIALNLLFVLLLFMVGRIDKKSISSSLKQQIIGTQYTESNWPLSAYGTMIDRFTECTALGAAVFDDESKSQFVQEILHTFPVTIKSGHRDPCGGLHNYLGEGDGILPQEYFRYWHGYDVYLRPMLGSGLALSQIYKANCIIAGALLFLFLGAYCRLVPPLVSIALIAILFLTTDIVSVPFVTVQSVPMFEVLTGGIFVCWWLARADASIEILYYIMLIAGAVYAFLDLLVTPPFAPALYSFLLMSAMCLRSSDHASKMKKALITSLSMTAVWFIAYGASWSMKWVVSSLFINPGTVFGNVAGQIVLRVGWLGHFASARDISEAFGMSTLRNFQMVGWKAISISLSLSAIALAYAVIVCHRRKEIVLDFCYLCAPSIIPLVWFEILRNHSIVHYWFTYRSAGLSLAIVASASLTVLVRARRYAENLAF